MAPIKLNQTNICHPISSIQSSQTRKNTQSLWPHAIIFVLSKTHGEPNYSYQENDRISSIPSSFPHPFPIPIPIPRNKTTPHPPRHITWYRMCCVSSYTEI